MNNKIKNAFDTINASSNLKDNTYRYIIDRKNKKNFLARRNLVVALIAVLIFVVSGSYLYFLPVYAISVDVDESIELSVNYFGRIVDVENPSDNTSIQVANLSYDEALEKLLTNYQSEDVVITVIDNNETRQAEIVEEIENCFTSKGNVYCQGANYNEVKEASNLGISYGKYKAYLELEKLGSNLTIDDIKEMSMKQLHVAINDLLDIKNEGESKKENGNGKQVQKGKQNKNGY